jgi:4-hydroxy-2-oxoheptanedioate aldolase
MEPSGPAESSLTKESSRRSVLAAGAAAVTLPLLQAAAGAMRPAHAQTTAPSTAPAAGAAAAGPAGSVTFNTVMTKLKAGKQVFSNTIESPDLDAAKKACEGQDFIWIEMQHSCLTWRESSDLIRTIAQAGCIPFVRVPSPTEGEIQKATDAGALGIIVPMVYSIQRARDAVMFAKYPVGNLADPNTKPWGHRSAGGNQASRLWPHYAPNANNNIMIVIQIENPAGVGLIDNILDEVEGIDVVMVASNDFGQHAGDRDGSPTYNAREETVRKSVLAHGKYLAGPSSWQTRPGYTVFQGRRSATNTGYESR